MSRNIIIGILCVLVIGLCVGYLDNWTRGKENADRLDAMKEESDRILEAVELRDYEGRVRDSFLMEEIGRSEERLQAWMVLRAQSWNRAQAYLDSVRIEKEVRDSVYSKMLEW